jgi:hypothetical protein
MINRIVFLDLKFKLQRFERKYFFDVFAVYGVECRGGVYPRPYACDTIVADDYRIPKIQPKCNSY